MHCSHISIKVSSTKHNYVFITDYEILSRRSQLLSFKSHLQYTFIRHRLHRIDWLRCTTAKEINLPVNQALNFISKSANE